MVLLIALIISTVPSTGFCSFWIGRDTWKAIGTAETRSKWEAAQTHEPVDDFQRWCYKLPENNDARSSLTVHLVTLRCHSPSMPEPSFPWLLGNFLGYYRNSLYFLVPLQDSTHDASSIKAFLSNIYLTLFLKNLSHFFCITYCGLSSAMKSLCCP